MFRGQAYITLQRLSLHESLYHWPIFARSLHAMVMQQLRNEWRRRTSLRTPGGEYAVDSLYLLREEESQSLPPSTTR